MASNFHVHQVKRVPLGELLSNVIDNRGKTPPTSPVGHEYIEVNSVTGNNKFVDYSVVRKFVNQETYDTWFRDGHPKIGDILFTTVGSIAEVCYVKEAKGCIAQNIVALRPDPEQVESNYLFYLFSAPNTRQMLMNLNQGVAQPSIRVPFLLKLPVFLPPLPIQKKIASILSAYDDLIENNNRRIKILEEMAQNIYREWFVHFRYPGHEYVPMVDSELGQIPQGWEVVPLGQISEKITKGTTPTTLGMPFQEQGINFFKVESIDGYGLILEDKLAHIDESTHDALQRSQLRENDLLFSIAGAIGRVSKIPGRLLPANTNQALAIIRLTAQQSSGVDYFFRVLRSDRFLHHSLGRVVQTAQANVSLGVLNQAPVLLPHGQTLSLFSEYVFPLEQSQESLIQMNQNLRKTRDLLLPKLISGQLDVEELDIKV